MSTLFDWQADKQNPDKARIIFDEARGVVMMVFNGKTVVASIEKWVQIAATLNAIRNLG